MRKLILLALILAASASGCRQQAPPTTSTQTASPLASGQPGAVAPTDGTGAVASADRASARWREVTIPAGTRLAIRLEQAVASDISRVDQPVRATLLNNIVVSGVTVVPAGSAVRGVVTEATRSARVKGLAQVGVRFDKLDVRGAGDPYTIRTGLVTRRATSTKGKDAAKIGVPAIGGAVLGGIFGGKKGALIGSTVGGGAGTAVVLSTRGNEVRLPRGTHLAVKLLDPITLRLPA